MGHILGRGLIFSAILMFGFILGIVYSNHISGDTDHFFQKKEDQSDTVVKTPSPFEGLKKPKENIIDMEDGDGVVIYNHNDQLIRDELIQGVDVKRDLLDKQTQAPDNNFFSQMGLRTADVFEGAFKSLFSLVK
ncbi:hypothetical protein ACERII_15925 [Evansella sp. AB-rgal1]|uniref:hypothetical protein n=1 Tax=Evansella sp. AB-rgal1 TaxID=3242696 RepID=UPI00359ED3DE